jgi:hypothetical protein
MIVGVIASRQQWWSGGQGQCVSALANTPVLGWLSHKSAHAEAWCYFPDILVKLEKESMEFIRSALILQKFGCRRPIKVPPLHD